MDKKKKKYIVLTIIAVLLIGLLILINVIGAGTKSASAESVIEYPTPQTTVRTTATEEYTDITQFAPSSEYRNYLVTKTFEDTYQIYWFEEGYVSQGFLNSYDEVLNSTFNTVYNKVGKVGNDETALSNWESTYIDAQKMEVISFSNFGYEGTAIKTEIKKSVSVSKTLVSDKFSSLDLLINAIINRSADLKTIDEIRSQLVIYPNDTLKLFGQEIYSNYNELNLIQIVQSSTFGNAFFSDIPQDLGPEIVNRANEQQKIKDDSYNEGYNEAVDKTWFGIFTDAVIEKIYKPNTWEDTSTDIIFTTYGISFDNAFAKIEEYRKTNQTPDTEAFYIQLKFSKPFKFQNDNDFYAKLYTNKKVMQSWFETETGRQIFITTDEEPNPNGFGYRIKTNEDLSEPITVRRLIICYTPYYKDTLASDFVDLGTGTNATEYNNGYVTGKNEGFENGYAQGKNDGYQNGYSAGLIEGQGPTTSIQKLIASVQAALNVDLFGSISLQDILNVMIAIFFVLIALKLFAGG